MHYDKIKKVGYLKYKREEEFKYEDLSRTSEPSGKSGGISDGTDGLFVENKRSERESSRVMQGSVYHRMRRWNICCLTRGRDTKASSLAIR